MESIYTLKLLPHEIEDVSKLTGLSVEEITKEGVIIKALVDIDTSSLSHHLYGVEVTFDSGSIIEEFNKGKGMMFNVNHKNK